MGAVISRVEPGSIAARYGFCEKDEIITINGRLLRDIIDYYFSTSEHRLEINYLRNGFPHTTVIHKKAEENLGLDFREEVFDGIIPCRYKCIFCFVNQMPGRMRESLYLHDDDYRLSFLHRNYITLTNLAENDLRRITAMRMSPLYVSVHATDPDVRAKIMGSPQAGNIMKMLKKLKLHDIQCHTQVVVVPGVNDDKALRKTLQDLYDLYPTVKTVAVVPVGVTKFRRDKKLVRPFNKAGAKQVFEIVRKFQAKAWKNYKTSLFYLADEFYMILGEEFPGNKHYGYYDQLGNGVGMARKFITEFNRRKRYIPKTIGKKRDVWIITGILGEELLRQFLKDLNKSGNLSVRLIPVENAFFGKNVTVTGLLTGQDISEALKENLKNETMPDEVLLPDVLLKDGRFLDDMKLSELKERLKVKIKAIPSNAKSLIENVVGFQRKHQRVEREEAPAEPVQPDESWKVFRGEHREEVRENGREWWENGELKAERRIREISRPPGMEPESSAVEKEKVEKISGDIKGKKPPYGQGKETKDGYAGKRQDDNISRNVKTTDGKSQVKQKRNWRASNKRTAGRGNSVNRTIPDKN